MIPDLKIFFELLTNSRDFTTPFPVILRRESSEWLESSIESDLGMRFVMRSLHLGFHNFAFFKLFPGSEQVIKNSILLTYFRDSG